jgi:hypothetical protein
MKGRRGCGAIGVLERLIDSGEYELEVGLLPSGDMGIGGLFSDPVVAIMRAHGFRCKPRFGGETCSGSSVHT